MFHHFLTCKNITKYLPHRALYFILGIMTGVEPVDKKDHHCFQFTRCNRCVTFDYGPDCTPEQIDYNVNY